MSAASATTIGARTSSSSVRPLVVDIRPPKLRGLLGCHHRRAMAPAATPTGAAADRAGAAAATATTTAAPSSATIPTVSTPAQALAALEGVDTVLLDQDGVLWRGDEDVAGADRALASLLASGRRLFFVTNNSTLSRAAYASKLSKRLGLDVQASQVVCSAWSAAEYLRSQGFGNGGDGGDGAAAAENGNGDGIKSRGNSDGDGSASSKNRGKRVLAIGEEGLFEELRLAGIEAVRGPVFLLETPTTGAAKTSATPTAAAAQTTTAAATVLPSLLPLASLDCRAADIAAFQLDPSIGAVVVGWSARQFTYAWVAYAAVCLREIPECLFLTTNTDAADALPAGRLLPGTGMIIAAVRAAASCGAPVDAGKGGEWLLRGLMPRAVPRFDPSRTAMVGDRLDTDVAFALQGGMRAALLTLTGVATRAQAEAAGLDRRPTHVLPSIAELTLEES